MKLSLFLLILSLLLNRVSNVLPLSIYPDLLACCAFICAISPGITTVSTSIIIICGLVLDALNLQPLGIRSVCCVIVLLFAKMNFDSLSEQKFNVVWYAFCGIYFISILITSVMTLTLLSNQSLYAIFIHSSMKYIFTILTYPLLHKVAIYTQNRFGYLTR